MNFDLGAVLSALITTGLAAVVTLTTAMSPSSRRIKRLERLVEVRERVEGAVTRRRLDYAIESLSYQVAEDAKFLGYRVRGRLLWSGAYAGAFGVGYLVYLVATEQTQWGFNSILALSLTMVGYLAVLIALVFVPETIEKRVKGDLAEPRRDERDEAARPEHVPGEGDEPRTAVDLDPGAASAGGLVEESEDVETAPAHRPLHPSPRVRPEDGLGDR